MIDAGELVLDYLLTSFLVSAHFWFSEFYILFNLTGLSVVGLWRFLLNSVVVMLFFGD